MTIFDILTLIIGLTLIAYSFDNPVSRFIDHTCREAWCRYDAWRDEQFKKYGYSRYYDDFSQDE